MQIFSLSPVQPAEFVRQHMLTTKNKTVSVSSSSSFALASMMVIYECPKVAPPNRVAFIELFTK